MKSQRYDLLLRTVDTISSPSPSSPPVAAFVCPLSRKINDSLIGSWLYLLFLRMMRAYSALTAGPPLSYATLSLATTPMSLHRQRRESTYRHRRSGSHSFIGNYPVPDGRTLMPRAGR